MQFLQDLLAAYEAYLRSPDVPEADKKPEAIAKRAGIATKSLFRAVTKLRHKGSITPETAEGIARAIGLRLVLVEGNGQ